MVPDDVQLQVSRHLPLCLRGHRLFPQVPARHRLSNIRQRFGQRYRGIIFVQPGTIIQERRDVAEFEVRSTSCVPELVNAGPLPSMSKRAPS